MWVVISVARIGYSGGKRRRSVRPVKWPQGLTASMGAKISSRNGVIDIAFYLLVLAPPLSHTQGDSLGRTISNEGGLFFWS